MTDSSKVLLPGPVPAYLHRSTTVHPAIVHGREQWHRASIIFALVGAVLFSACITAAVMI